jgi:hypothetical protein
MTTSTLAATVATATATAAASAATAARSLERIVELLELGLFGRARINNRAHKLQVAAGKRVIEVHNNLERGNLLHCTKDGRAVGTHHFNNIAGIYVCRIELAINGEHLTVKILNVVGVILAISIGKWDCKVKGIALLQVLQVILKGIESIAHTCQEGERLLACCLLNFLTLTVAV